MSHANHVKLLLLSIVLIVVYSPLIGQKKADLGALIAVLEDDDTVPLKRALAQVEIANYYIYHDLDSASVHIDAVLEGVRQGDYILPDTFHKHLLIKAWTHQGKQEYTPAKRYLYKAMEVAKSKEARKDRIELMINLGSMLVQTRDTGVIDFVDRELLYVDTTLSKDDYVMYTLLHKYKSNAYAQQENYEMAIRTLLKVNGAAFLDKIPNYKYGIRSALSSYLAYMGDGETAIKQLELALRDSLYIHQEQRLYYDLCRLHVGRDSMPAASVYHSLFDSLSSNSAMDQRDGYYLAALIAKSSDRYVEAKRYIDSAHVYQANIEDSQKKLDVLLLKASLSEKLESVTDISHCLGVIDTLMVSDPTLGTSLNMAAVARLRLLNNFLVGGKSMVSDFASYEKNHAKLVRQKIDPKLVAAVLNFDQAENEAQINLLTAQGKAKDINLQSQGVWLNYSLGSLVVMSCICFLFYGFGRKRQRLSEEIKHEKLIFELKAKAEKEKMEADAIRERMRMEAAARDEKIRLRAEAAEERRLLQEKQHALKQRVQHIEKSNLELQDKIDSSQHETFKEFVTISMSTKVHKIKVDQLLYVTAEQDGSRFHLTDRDFWIIKPLKEVIKELPPSQFVRIFRSAVVNIGFIAAVNSKYIVLENGEELTMGRTYRDEVRRRVG